MYTDSVISLTLAQLPSNIIFKETSGKVIDKDYYKLEDLRGGFLVANALGFNHLPDWGIIGDFKMENGGANNTFIVNSNGSHMLYVTGVPLNDSKDFMLNYAIMKAYWQDNEKGYLFQTIKK